MLNTMPATLLLKLNAICLELYGKGTNEAHCIEFTSPMHQHSHIIENDKQLIQIHLSKLTPLYIVATTDYEKSGVVYVFAVGTCSHCNKLFISKVEARYVADYTTVTLDNWQGAVSNHVYTIKLDRQEAYYEYTRNTKPQAH